MFRAIALSFLVLFHAGQTTPPAADAAKKALDQIQGSWQIVTLNGQDAPAGTDFHLTFAADKYEQWVNGSVEERGTFKLNPTTKPMSIDLMIAEGSDAGKLQLGLYELATDTLSLAFAAPGDPVRPKTPADGAINAVLKKMK
jgi:uncharacterized protein (TIGR03067 family)